MLTAMRAFLILWLVLAAPAASAGDDDFARGIGAVVAAIGVCDGLAVDLDALDDRIAEQVGADRSAFDARVTGHAAASIARIKALAPAGRDAHCARMARIVETSGLGGLELAG